jgi:type III secretion protein W
MPHEPIRAINQPSSAAAIIKAELLEAQENAELFEAAQIATTAEFLEARDQYAFNPLAMMRRFETLEKRTARPAKDDSKPSEESQTPKIEEVGEVSEEVSNKNRELESNTLEELRSKLSETDTVEDIIRKVQDSYPDEYLADEALDYLIRTTNNKSALGQNLLAARKKFNELFKREVIAGRNMTIEASSFANQGIGTASNLRQLYKEVTAAQKETLELFEQLTAKYDYEQMTKVLKFLLHSLGADMKSKGPSIARAELQMLFNETRSMQAILGIYRFFQSRMNLISKEFERNSLVLPGALNFDILAKQFVKMVAERYPSIDKILKLSTLLGLGDNILAQIIVFTQFRDALRQVSLRLFKSEKQRQDLLLTLLDALSDLEDELDEEDDEEEA